MAVTCFYGSERWGSAPPSSSRDIQPAAPMAAAASSRIVDASASRLSMDNALARLRSDVARLGRNASGRAPASCRWMGTASSMAARASSRRPSSLALPRRGSEVGEPVVGDGQVDRAHGEPAAELGLRWAVRREPLRWLGEDGGPSAPLLFRAQRRMLRLHAGNWPPPSLRLRGPVRTW